MFALHKRVVYYHSIGAGVDAILTRELVESDIVLASEKGEVGIHLAEHAFALLLGLTRGLHTAIRKPDYTLREPIRLEQRELYQLTMGIVGFGGTGREVAERALGFGMRVLAEDIEDVPRSPASRRSTSPTGSASCSAPPTPWSSACRSPRRRTISSRATCSAGCSPPRS